MSENRPSSLPLSTPASHPMTGAEALMGGIDAGRMREGRTQRRAKDDEPSIVVIRGPIAESWRPKGRSGQRPAHLMPGSEWKPDHVTQGSASDDSSPEGSRSS